jgi:hypothetical protein
MRRSRDEGLEEDEDDRLTRSLAGLAVALALVVAGLFLMQQLRSASALQDCLMQRRANCAPIGIMR